MKIFQPTLEIKSKSGELHFRRFAIFETKYVSLYIHRIYRADKDVYFHSHPWNFLSVILKGHYIEGSPKGNSHKKFLTFSKMTRNNFHNVKEIVSGPVWSLFFAFGKKQMWYYLVNGDKIEFTRFREIKNLPEYQYLFK